MECPSVNSTKIVVAFVKALKSKVERLTKITIHTMEMFKNTNVSNSIYFVKIDNFVLRRMGVLFDICSIFIKE